MAPPNWNHVDHELTRKVLAGDLFDDESVGEALTFARDCLNADADNEDVTDKMIYARGKAYEHADLAYGEDDLADTVKALRRFWSV